MKLHEEFKEYETLWNMETPDILTEAMSAEEKVDAWYEGTRLVNYKAASETKLKKYLTIAKAKGYLKIVDDIEAELEARSSKEEPGPTVYVDGEDRIMPKYFYDALNVIDAEIEILDIGYSDRDAYDDHYWDGEKVQWRSMWNLFDIEDLDLDTIDEIEKKLNSLAKSYSDKLSVDIDKDMFEDEGVLNIGLYSI